jgi:hypothetical protein
MPETPPRRRLTWRDAVPELPQRFATTLTSVNGPLARSLAQAQRTGQEAELALVRGGRRDAAHVVVLSTGARLGSLPRREAALLADLGADASSYRPHILEVQATPRGRVEGVVIDLVHSEHSEQAPVALHGLLEGATREVAGEAPPLP